MLRYDIRTGVNKIKTKAFIAVSAVGLAAAGTAGSMAILGSAHALNTSTAVTPSNMHGWYFYDDQNDTTSSATGQMVSGPATPPLGAGSAQLSVAGPSDGQAIANNDYAGTKLSDISNFDYWTYQPAGAQAVALQFDVKYRSSDTAYGGRLVFEPYVQPGQAGTVASGWQHWTNLTSGLWWASKTTAAGSNGVCGQATPCTWNSIKSQFPDAQINGRLLLKVGSGWSAATYNTDALTVNVNGNSTTYNFEKFVATGNITAPGVNSYNRGTISLSANYSDGDTPNKDDGVQWAVRSGTCTAGQGTVAGNVDGYHDTAAWNGNNFTYSLNTTTLSDGSYCFVFNPSDDPGQPDIRLTQNFFIDNTRPDVAFVSPTDFSQTFNGGPIVTVSASDNLSGLQNLVIHVYDSSNNPAKFCTATSAELTAGQMSCDLSSLADGTYYIKAGAFDKAGNNRTINSGNFVILHSPTTLDQCKNGGWQNFSSLNFRNQGACVSYVNHHDGNGADDTHAH